jgi:hypothetical protein
LSLILSTEIDMQRFESSLIVKSKRVQVLLELDILIKSVDKRFKTV